MAIHVTVKLYGLLQDIMWKERRLRVKPGITVKEVLDELEVAEYMISFLTVNGKRVSMAYELKDNDMLMVFPWIIGG
jgi:molybdopterin converting factor small subunit